MKNTVLKISTLLLSTLLLSGCNSIGDKATSMSIIYGFLTVVSLLMIFSYCKFIKDRKKWFIILFSSISVVNLGYFLLSVSSTLEQALMANRFAYLGSVLLPLSMLMIILDVAKLKHPKWLSHALFGVAFIVFLIAASPGILTIYYKDVSLEIVNGVAVLIKEYGPWHKIYLFYLLGYFLSIAATVIITAVKKKLSSSVHTIILAFAVFINTGVWLLEQLVKIDFEFLSVSYIISGFFLIGLYLMVEHPDSFIVQPSSENKAKKSADIDDTEYHCAYIKDHLDSLTVTEHTIYECYMAGKTTKEILKELNITENTLKFHNKNIYSKLGVSSRKQLVYCSNLITKKE